MLDFLFELNKTFILEQCRMSDCPFLVSTACSNFTYTGVKTRKKEWGKNHLAEHGCCNVLLAILENKDFFIGKRLNYSDGSNQEEIKILTDIRFDLTKRNKLELMVKTKRDKIPFVIAFNTDYLSMEFMDEKNVTFIDHLSKVSVDIEI